MYSIEMNVTVDKNKLLQTLKANRAAHKGLYEDARKGYCENALKAVISKMEVLKLGEPVALAFSFSPPQDMTSVYDTAVKMMEWNMDDKVTLDAVTFNRLVEDDWDWSHSWFKSNSQYSHSVAMTGSVKGYK